MTVDELTKQVRGLQAIADRDDPRVAPLRTVLYGDPGSEGEMCPECRGKAGWNTSYGFKSCQFCNPLNDNQTGRIGARPARAGLAVPCLGCMDCVPERHLGRMERHNCHGTGWVLNVLLAQLVREGEDESACGFLLRRLDVPSLDKKAYQAIWQVAVDTTIEFAPTFEALVQWAESLVKE